MTHLRSSYNNIEGLLIGEDWDKAIIDKVVSTKLNIILKRLGIDVPTELRKCLKCDRFCDANRSRCPYCGHKNLQYWDPIEGKFI